MARQRLTVKDTNGFRPSVANDRREQTVLSTQDFLELHSKFIQHKALEGLAPRTIKDHLTHMGYFKKFLVEDHRSKLDRCVDVDLFRGYLTHMMTDKNKDPRLSTVPPHLILPITLSVTSEHKNKSPPSIVQLEVTFGIL